MAQTSPLPRATGRVAPVRGSRIRIPDFFMVGAPKCGTTAMYHYLREHPQIFMPFHKEPLFFGSDLTPRYGPMSFDDYAALFRDAHEDQRVGEASTWYLYSRLAAREIKEASPDARIVIMLRNPIDVMHAQHSTLVFVRHENIVAFDEALAAEPDRKLGRRLPPGPIRRENLFYREMAQFSEQVERYIETFGRERVHFIIHDDLRADTAAEYRKLLQFLQVDPDFQPRFEHFNENRVVRSRLAQRLIFTPPLIGPIIPRLRRYRAMHWVRQRLMELNGRRADRQQMKPELRRRLIAEFAPEVERLGRLIGRDLSAWTSGLP